MLPALGTAQAYDLFERQGLSPVKAFLSLNWLLLPLAAVLLILDVAIRRIQIDKAALIAARQGLGNFVRSWTTVNPAVATDGKGAVDALRKIRGKSGEAPAPTLAIPPPVRPNPKAKFEAKTNVSGDISQVVGGAKNEPTKRPTLNTPTNVAPGEKADTTSSLLAAKRRAQQKMNDDQDGV